MRGFSGTIPDPDELLVNVPMLPVDERGRSIGLCERRSINVARKHDGFDIDNINTLRPDPLVRDSQRFAEGIPRAHATLPGRQGDAAWCKIAESKHSPLLRRTTQLTGRSRCKALDVA